MAKRHGPASARVAVAMHLANDPYLLEATSADDVANMIAQTVGPQTTEPTHAELVEQVTKYLELRLKIGASWTQAGMRKEGATREEVAAYITEVAPQMAMLLEEALETGAIREDEIHAKIRGLADQAELSPTRNFDLGIMTREEADERFVIQEGGVLGNWEVIDKITGAAVGHYYSDGHSVYQPGYLRYALSVWNTMTKPAELETALVGLAERRAESARKLEEARRTPFTREEALREASGIMGDTLWEGGVYDAAHWDRVTGEDLPDEVSGIVWDAVVEGLADAMMELDTEELSIHEAWDAANRSKDWTEFAYGVVADWIDKRKQ